MIEVVKGTDIFGGQGIFGTTRARNPNLSVIVAGAFVPKFFSTRDEVAYRQMYERLATKNQAMLIPDMLNGVARQTDLLLGDGIHPNSQGHARIAATFWEPLVVVINSAH